MADKSLNDWIDFPNLYIQETAVRESLDADSLCTYGIRCLDEALVRIGKSELVTIGADTGAGKSEIALQIAQHNALQGKMVGVYYLEGGSIEAMQRMKWRQISSLYYSEYGRSAPPISYQHWIYNIGTNPLLLEIENRVYEEYRDKLKDKLYFYPSQKAFTIEKFRTSLVDFLEWVEGKLYLDLIVIDHLQFFSLTSTESNEIQEITKVLRAVKDITEYYNKPIILVSHLRKRGKNAGMPTFEDFYGSGNISKISTTSIMLSKKKSDNYAKGIFPTYIRIAKSRVGIPNNYAFLTDFDLNTRTYAETYDIYPVNDMGFTTDNPLATDELPRWARGARYS